MNKSTSVTVEKLYTVSAVLQIYEYVYTENFFLSLKEIRGKYDSWTRTGREVLLSSVLLSDDFVKFNGYTVLLGLVRQYEDTFVITRNR